MPPVTKKFCRRVEGITIGKCIKRKMYETYCRMYKFEILNSRVRVLEHEFSIFKPDQNI